MALLFGGHRGQSLVEVLVAAFVIALLTVGVMSLVVLSQRMLLGSERHVVALNIINERRELVKSLSYNDVVIDPAGSIPSAVEDVVRNDQTYTLTTNIEIIDDPLTADVEDYKKVEIVVEWTAPSGVVRDSSVVTYVTSRDNPEVCTSCETGLCDLTTGVCDSPVGPPAGGGEPCTPGLLCSNGALCPLTRVCPDDTTIPSVPNDSKLCRLGQVCSSGALCPLSGVCPQRSCPDGTCPPGNACFSGFCYSWEWYSLTLESVDQGNPADSVAMECASDVCSNTTDCPGNCQSDCQFIESDGFTGCGRWQVIRECGRTWIPDCREAVGGGAFASCRGGYDGGGGCADLECVPVACPAPDPLVDPDRSWCLNGEECNLTSSNAACLSDGDCSVGEVCDGVSGTCRTICPDKAECSSYWGGWAKGCRVSAVVAGGGGCNNAAGVCQGAGGNCATEYSLSLVTVKIENVDPNDYSVVLANPVEVLEGATGELTEVAWQVTLTGPIVDIVTVRVDLQDGLATEAGSDYSGPGVTLTFEPDGPLSQVVTADVVGDDMAEIDENFSAVITKARSIAHEVAGLGEAAEVMIVNDDITVEIADTTALEGDPLGQRDEIVFTVTRRGSARASVDIVLETQEGTALAGSDYVEMSNVNLTIGASASLTNMATVTVDIASDTTYELDEYFFMNIVSADLNLAGLIGLDALIDTVVIVDEWGLGTIVDDDDIIDIENAAAVGESNGPALFTLRLRRGASDHAVHVWVSTQDGTAVAGSDYLARVSEKITIPTGWGSQQVAVGIVDDVVHEPNPPEDFTMSIDSISGADIGGDVAAGWVIDDDPLPLVTINDVLVTEGDIGTTSANLAVSLSWPYYGGDVSVQADTVDGTALAGSDYTEVSEVVTFSPGEVSKGVSVDVTGDTDEEEDEDFVVRLSDVVNGVISVQDGVVTIMNDDVLPPP